MKIARGMIIRSTFNSCELLTRADRWPIGVVMLGISPLLTHYQDMQHLVDENYFSDIFSEDGGMFLSGMGVSFYD